MVLLSENILIYSLTALLCVVVVAIYLRKKSRESRIVEEKIKKAKEEFRLKKQELDFNHWIVKERLWYKMPYRLFWYWIKSRGDHNKEIQYWKKYFITNILSK